MAAVDVIIITFDRPALYLARAIDDVLAQEFTDWHLYVGVDGTDPDKAHRLIEQRGLQDRATVVAVPEQIGIPALVNRCAARGTSEFIAKHDDDDTWHSQFLTRTVDHLRTTDDLVVATRLEVVFEKQIGSRFIETGRKLFRPGLQEVTYLDLVSINRIIPISILFRREAWERFGFNEDRIVVDDWEFNLAVAQTGRYGLIDEVLAYWHQRPGATGTGGNTVIAGRRVHGLDDRRMRDERLRDYVASHGDGELLYAAKYVEERFGELGRRLDEIEEQQQEILRMLSRR